MRFMMRTPDGHWIINCKACLGCENHFDRASQCHAWWDQHIQTERHREIISKPLLERPGHVHRLLGVPHQRLTGAQKDAIAKYYRGGL